MNLLHLYQKSRSQGLDAQELALIEQAAREHPFFGLGHQVTARHHLGENTTIKDRALLVGAAYAADRNVLHGYVSDLLQPAKGKGNETKPSIPNPEPVAQSTEAPEEVPSAVPVEVPATQAPDQVIPTAPEEVPAPAEEPAPPVPATPIEPEPETEPETEPEIEPEVEPEAPPAPETEAVMATVAEPVPTPVVVPAVAAEAPAPVVVGINWFLNMRIRLRASKFSGMAPRIRASVAAHAAHVDSPPAPAPTPQAEVKPLQVPVEPKAAAAPEPDAKPQENYAIGAFSSFTFLRDQDMGESSEGEDQGLVMEPETFSVEASLHDDLPSEIIFEEGGRIVEIVVSPELLERFFKGRLPIDLKLGESMHAPAETPKEDAKLLDPKARRKKSADLIDRFIEADPVMPKVNAVSIPSGDLSRYSNQDKDEWVTETLARIYAQQGNRAKAIKIYQKLGLLFPDKKDYFAARIAELK